MLERKKLVYGDGIVAKPKIMKTLVFSATFLATLTACSPSTNAIPKRDPAVEEARHSRTPLPRLGEQTIAGCFPDIARMTMERAERVTETVCRGNREFVLTDRALYIRTRVDQRLDMQDSEVTLNNYYSRTDMRGLIARGIVDWEATESACYILTRDRKLTVLANEDIGETVPEFELEFETSGLGRNRMFVHSGFLFIAPLSGETLVMSVADHMDSRFLPLVSSDAREGFFLSQNRLFFGRKGNGEREIRIGGQRSDDVALTR